MPLEKLKMATVKMVSLCDDVDINDYKLTPKQQKVAELLTVVEKASVKEVCYYTGYTQSVIDSLVKKKIARYFTDEVMRIPYTVSDVKKDEVILSPYNNLLLIIYTVNIVMTKLQFLYFMVLQAVAKPQYL